MSNPLHISTDKSKYHNGEDVIVTAKFDNWPAKIQIRLVLWIYHTNNHILNQYFSKPASGDTVKWTIPWGTFESSIVNGHYDFDAQAEFGHLHVDAQFYYGVQ